MGRKKSPHEGKKPEELFEGLFQKCEKFEITPKEFRELPAVKKLRAGNRSSGGEIWFYFFLLSLFIAVCALVAVSGWQHLMLVFVKMVFYWGHWDPETEKCVLGIPENVRDMLLPPFDCSICRNLTTVERVPHISPEDFENKYAYSLVPVIVSDGAANWTAQNTFSFDFFRKLYVGDNGTMIREWTCSYFFPYQTEFINLADALSMSSDREKEPWYIGWSNCDRIVGSILRKHYNRPYFLPRQSESSNVDWIFMGTPGYGADMHIDNVDGTSWQAQIKGTKLWTLQPMPECYNECTSLEAVVHPGEVIVLDANRWFHKTLILGNELSITIGSEFD